MTKIQRTEKKRVTYGTIVGGNYVEESMAHEAELATVPELGGHCLSWERGGRRVLGMGGKCKIALEIIGLPISPGRELGRVF